MSLPDFRHENEALLGGHHGVVGLDEAGRGPWAGPVVAAAAWIDPTKVARLPLAGLNDSKKLSASRRETLFKAMQETPSVRLGVGFASVEEIDSLNILAASHLAMVRAFSDLSLCHPALGIDFALVDGNRLPDLPCEARALVKGDSLSLSIAAASIAAKVTRDRVMAELALEWPGYGWEKNQGYGTKAHQEALQRLRPSPHHRKSFKPIAALLAGNS